MWIKIEKDIFENSDFEGLSYIFCVLSWSPRGSISRYNILIDIKEIENLDNYKLLKVVNNNLDLLIETQFDEYINSKSSSSNPEYVISNKKKDKSFNIEEANRFFNQPFSIILENNKNDAYFLNAIFEHFDKIGKIKEHLKNGWIKFENAGGCSNVKNFIDGELKSFDDLASRNGKNSFEYYRGFVILDSDKEYKNQAQKNQYLELSNYLLTISMASNFHILNKRMMENYMPSEVFEDIKSEYNGKFRYKEQYDWLNVYLYLNDEQKDFLNLQKGFSKELDDLGSRKAIQNEVKDLFSLHTKDFDILDNGFKFPDFKNSFPELFLKSPRVNEYSLKNRSGSNELEEIVDKISKLL